MAWIADRKQGGGRRTTLGLIGVVLVGLGIVGCDSSVNAFGPDKVTLNAFEAISCAKQIVVGRAVRVEDGEKKDTVTVTVDVEEWIKPTAGPSSLVLANIVDPDSFGGKPWETGARRLLYVPAPDDLRFTAAEVAQISVRPDGGKDLEDSIQATKSELAQGLRTTCPSK